MSQSGFYYSINAEITFAVHEAVSFQIPRVYSGLEGNVLNLESWVESLSSGF